MFQTITVTQEVSPSSGSFSQLGDHLRVFRFCGQVILIQVFRFFGQVILIGLLVLAHDTPGYECMY